MICFVLSVTTLFAQKNKDTEVESKPSETKVETKSEDPPPPPPPQKTEPDTPTTYEAPSPPASEPTRSSTDDSSRKNDPPDTPTNPPAGRRRANYEQQQRNRAQQKADIERQRREEEEEKRRRKKDKNKSDCPYYDTYGNCDYGSSDDDSNYTAVDPSAYFGTNDVAYLDYESFADSNPDNYLPYFENPLRPEFTPLYRVLIMETSRDLPFYLAGWVFYYEPDLDNFFIDFAKFGQFKYERLVLLPAEDKTIKKVNKKFGYKGSVVRPVLVEDISNLATSSIYSFNLNELPEGSYILILVNQDGSTVKRRIEIK